MGVTKGKPLVVYTVGDTAFGIGYYCKDVDVNILSMGELEEQGIKSEKKDNLFIVLFGAVTICIALR